MQRKELVVRPTAMALALMKAAEDFLRKYPDRQLSEAISNWQPRRSLKREPVWSVTRKGK